jgi:cell wall-associated NlpC family hydrolase
MNRCLALFRLAALPGALALFAHAQAQSLPEQPWEPVPSGLRASASIAALPAAAEPAAAAATRMEELLFRALSLVGVRYRPGGISPDTGFDCSGYVGYLFREVLAIHLPRTSDGLGRFGTEVARDALQPGDLVFFNTMHRHFTHVGIYIGENRFVHAPASGGQVRTEDLNLQYWAARWDGARRISLR